MVRTRLGARIRLCIVVVAVILGMLTAGSVPILDAGAMGPEVSRVCGDSVYATGGSPVIAVGAAGNACSGYTQCLITRWVYGPDTRSPLDPTAITKDVIIGAATAAAFHGATKLLTPTTPHLTPPPTTRATGQRIALGLGDDIGGIYESGAGLRYGPGRYEGHRLQHVMQHGAPNLSKANHSVFVGGRGEVLRVVDEAWLTRGNAITLGGRDKFIVPMGREVGTAGQRHVTIIVEKGTKNIITAYPSGPN